MESKAFAKNLKTRELWYYASGEGATSITLNGMTAYAMLFLTQILGMDTVAAGLALSIATIWDAVTDPLMGTISDRTNTRFGRRHPYMLIGGMFMALSFLALWFVPESFRDGKMLFVYLLCVSILLRTAFTVFVVPYTAFGFEMCKTDDDRARLQGVRYGFNMIINIIFVGFGWMLFFPERVGADGVEIDGTKIHGNYLNMGAILAASAFLLIVFCVFLTYKHAQKGLTKTEGEGMGHHVRAFFHDIRDVYSDRLVWFVFIFFLLAQFSMTIVAQVQMFTYVEYMKFSAGEKSFVHIGGMVGFALGSLCLGSLVKRLDKKKTGFLAMVISSFGCLALLALFTGGLLDPQAKIGAFPLAVVAFGLLQMLWWGGCGILVPLATSMIADLSLVKRLKTGEVTEGRYAAGFSFFMKVANSLAMLVVGYILKGVGYVSGEEFQTPETLDKLALMTFIVGPIMMLLSFFVLRKYPITHESMNEIRKQYGKEEG
jgi:GPH family glycoside/pentoside/hexuronide:cation symporter